MSGARGIQALRHIVTRRYFAVLILFAALFVYFSLTQDRFLTSGNIDALITGSSILWMVAIGPEAPDRHVASVHGPDLVRQRGAIQRL